MMSFSYQFIDAYCDVVSAKIFIKIFVLVIDFIVKFWKKKNISLLLNWQVKCTVSLGWLCNVKCLHLYWRIKNLTYSYVLILILGGYEPRCPSAHTGGL